MRIVQINTLGATQSTGRTTRQMHDYFQSHDMDSYIICPTNLDCDDVITISSSLEMKIDVLMTEITGLEAYHSFLPTRKLISALKLIKPDIVHLRILHSNYVNVPRLLRFLGQNNIPTVITLHDFWFITGLCCHYTTSNCQKWQSGCKECPVRKKMPRPLLFDRTEKMWRDKITLLSNIEKLAIVGVSDWATSEVLKSPVAQYASIKRIYNWIDLTVFRPRNSILREQLKLTDKFVILAVASSWVNNAGKGLNHYIELAKVMPENYRIILVGRMDEKIKIPKNILSVGSCTKSELLADYYSMADVYLNLSTEETFGKVSAEALSCGTPVVAIDSTANKELVSINCGIVVKNTYIAELLSALAEIEINTKNYYSDHCRKYAEQNFSMEKNIIEYIQLYRELQN